MSRICFILYSLVVSFIISVSDSTFVKDYEISHKEKVKVRIISNEGKFREKRSEDVTAFPNRVDIHIQGTEMTRLNLRRVRRTPAYPTIFSMTNHGLFQENIPDEIRETGFYQDGSNMAFVTLTKHKGTIEVKSGSFVKDGQLHMLEKVKNSSKDSESNAHYLTKVKQPLDFRGDDLVFDAKSHTGRQRRQLDGTGNATNTTTSDKPRELYLEYVTVVDYKSYTRWREQVAGNETSENKDLLTKSEIIQFYRHTVHGIDVIFSSASSDRSTFHVLLTGIVICNESESSQFIERHKICDTCIEIDDQQSLMGFYQWRESVLLKRLKHDHAALFTGYDLYHTDLASKSTVGVSFVGTVCENWSVSVMEERRNALSIHTAAHELGHSFGAYHDGTTNAAACPGSDKHIMQSRMTRIKDKTKAHNPWTFSPCSISNIMDYLGNLDRKDQNCLLNKPSYEKPPDQEPGLQFSADTQCRAILGQNSSVCREYHFQDWSSLCYGLACNNLETGQCKSVLPYDGTPCGFKKWCKQGLCIYNEGALEMPDYCPLGDDPSYVCDKDSCDNILIHNATCCDTCSKTENKSQAPTDNYTTSNMANSHATKNSETKNVTMTTPMNSKNMSEISTNRNSNDNIVTMSTLPVHSENITENATNRNYSDKTVTMTTVSTNSENITKTSLKDKFSSTTVTTSTPFTNFVNLSTTTSKIDSIHSVTKDVTNVTKTNLVAMTTEKLTTQRMPIDKMNESTTEDLKLINRGISTNRPLVKDTHKGGTTKSSLSKRNDSISRKTTTPTRETTPQIRETASYARETTTQTREINQGPSDAKGSNMNPRHFGTVFEITESPHLERNDIIKELNSKSTVILQNDITNEASDFRFINLNVVIILLIVRSIL